MNVASRFLAIATILSLPATSLAQRSKAIEIVATDGGSKIASIHLNDQNLLFEPGDGTDTFLFTAEALITIKHKDKTYSIQSYDDLQALASRKASEIAKSPVTAGTAPDVVLRLTDETDTISGQKSRKLIKLSEGKPDAEIWVSSDLVPKRLRAVGERLRSVLPEDYWSKMHGNPGMVEIIMLYGIPMKMVNNGNKFFQSRVLVGSSSRTSFKVPSGYRKTGN